MSGPPTPAPSALLTIGPAVTGDNLFGREQEISQLWQHLQRQHVLLLAPRRVGKTSLMFRLREQPDANFDVVYVDLEAGHTPEYFVSKLTQELASAKVLHSLMKRVPWLTDLLGRVKSVEVMSVKAEIQGIGWQAAGEQIFRALREHAKKVLIILDEFPLFLQEMAKGAGANPGLVGEFLGWFRGLRQHPDLVNQTRYLLGGSIGLQGVLRRLRVSGYTNDFHPFALNPYDRDTALRYIQALEVGEAFPLRDDEREAILNELGYFVPFHIQLVFGEMKDMSPHASSAVPLGSRVPQAITRLLKGDATQFAHQAERIDDSFHLPAERKVARALLTVVCQSAEGCAIEQLQEAAAKVSPEPRDPSADDEQLKVVLDTLCHDGYLVHSPGPEEQPGSYMFVSHLLRRYWRQRYTLRAASKP